MPAVTYALGVSYKIRLPSRWTRSRKGKSQPHPAEEGVFNDILSIVRRDVTDFKYDGRTSRRELTWSMRTSSRARGIEKQLKRLRRAYPKLNIKTEVSVRRPTLKDNVNAAIANLLAGSEPNDVIEDLSRTSALYAASMMHFNKLGKEAAEKKADEIIGSVPADDTLHSATVNTGIPKTTPTYSHIVKMGHYVPEKKRVQLHNQHGPV